MKVLPPVRGTMFIAGPPTSFSPSPPGGGHGDLRGVLHVRGVARDAAAVDRGAGVQAVELQTAFVAAAAAAAEHDHAGLQLHVVVAAAARHHRRNQREDGVARARGRDRRQHLGRQGLLPLRALHVDHRRLAGDRDRLFHRADLQIGADRGDDPALELQPFLLDGAEAGQRERDAIQPGPQADDPVLAGAVGHDRSHLLNQFRAGGFDRHPRQDPARRVLHDAGDRRRGLLGRRHRREQGECGDGRQHYQPAHAHTCVSMSARFSCRWLRMRPRRVEEEDPIDDRPIPTTVSTPLQASGA